MTIKEHHEKKKLKINLLCKIAGIVRSDYYYQVDNTRKEDRDIVDFEVINSMPDFEKTSYGCKRKSKYLLENHQIRMNHKKILRLEKKFGLKIRNRIRKYPKDYYVYQKECSANLPENILNQEFFSARPLKKLATDISYFKITGGWLFLSVVLDLYNNQILSCKCSRHPDTNLVLETMNDLFQNYKVKGALIHSDQGSPYRAYEYRNLLKSNECIQSMSRAGHCRDNACVEHFFGDLKSESAYYDSLKNGMLNFNQMKKLIDEYIDFYNHRRIQKKLNWKSPVKYLEGAA